MLRTVGPLARPLARSFAKAAAPQEMRSWHVGGTSKGMVTTMQCEGSKHSIILDGSDTKEAGQGADPHSALLSALCGCQTTILNKMCEEEKVRLNSLMFDVRGWQDSGATQRDSKASSKLQRVDMDVQVDSDASQDQLDSMAKQLLRRSPMTNLLHDAGVKLRLNVKQMTENE